ncbi:hypothetical protein FQA39_LY13197 [Lamprigera yunnana]|nr:hypothetical protein FQA39_LY13197 [Lamprigera yunnana]
MIICVDRDPMDMEPCDDSSDIEDISAILNSKISLGDEPDIFREYKIIDEKSLALRVYLGELNEHFGSFLRSRNPPNLEMALRYVKEELDIRYFQNNNKQSQFNYENRSNALNNRNNNKDIIIEYNNNYNNEVNNDNNKSYNETNNVINNEEIIENYGEDEIEENNYSNEVKNNYNNEYDNEYNNEQNK